MSEQTAARRASLLEQAIKDRAVELGIVDHDTHLDIFQTIQLVRDISQVPKAPDTPKARLEVEISDLETRLTKLQAFLDTDTFKGLPDYSRSLLIVQSNLMTDLLGVLKQRLEIME